MEIIPAIDLLEGKCVRLNQGDYNKVTEFNNDPVEQALSWQSLGAKKLHLVDLDGAKTGKPHNDSKIKEIKNAIEIPIQIGGGIRSFDRAKELLDFGIENIILGTIAIEEPDLVERLSKQYPGKISVGIDAKEGKVATRGWLKQSKITAMDLTKKFNRLNLASIISTDISTDGTLEGPNIQSLLEIAEISTNPIIASGGIGSISDINSLMACNCKRIVGVIIGRALYDGTIDLAEALRTVSTHLLKDTNLENRNPIT